MSHIVRRKGAIFVKSVVFFLLRFRGIVIFYVSEASVLLVFAKIAFFCLKILRKIAIFTVFTVFTLRKLHIFTVFAAIF